MQIKRMPTSSTVKILQVLIALLHSLKINSFVPGINCWHIVVMLNTILHYNFA